MAQVINLRCLKRTPWNFVARSQHLIDQKQVTLFKIRKSEGTACLRNWWIDCCNTNYRQEYDVRHSDQTLLLAKTEKPPKLKRQTSCNLSPWQTTENHLNWLGLVKKFHLSSLETDYPFIVLSFYCNKISIVSEKKKKKNSLETDWSRRYCL